MSSYAPQPPWPSTLLWLVYSVPPRRSSLSLCGSSGDFDRKQSSGEGRACLPHVAAWSWSAAVAVDPWLLALAPSLPIWPPPFFPSPPGALHPLRRAGAPPASSSLPAGDRFGAALGSLASQTRFGSVVFLGEEANQYNKIHQKCSIRWSHEQKGIEEANGLCLLAFRRPLLCSPWLAGHCRAAADGRRPSGQGALYRPAPRPARPRCVPSHIGHSDCEFCEAQ
jgi:hypothetical protein